jgi:1,4-dihydroxy-2-naphthoate octaprenyltransferase
MALSKITPWLLVARPKTLAAAMAPVILGFWLAARRQSQPLEVGLLLLTLGCTTALQVATNGFNDALDFAQGKDTTARLGPQRMSASGRLSASQVMRAAALMLGLAAALSLPLIYARGWPIVAIGIPSLYFCYGYTGGPLPLAYHGLGEIFVMLFFGLVAVAGSAFVQSGMWMPEALVAGLQVGALSTVLIAINNLRDLDEDRSTGKRTLAVRLGLKGARMEICALMLAPHAALPWWVARGWPEVGWASLWLLPLQLWLCRRICIEPPSRAHNRLLALAALQLVAFTTLFCLAWR